MNVEQVSAEVVDAALQLHRRVGPRLLESVYEVALAHALEKRGLKVERQLPVPLELDGLHFRRGVPVGPPG